MPPQPRRNLPSSTHVLAAAVALVACGTIRAQPAAASAGIASSARAHVLARARSASPALPRTPISLYERTTSQWILRRQGCRAARERQSGIVILDFGRPAFHRHAYGTTLFSRRFASDRSITRALLAYAGGYSRCLPRGSQTQISLARGTSNDHPKVPNAFRAGLLWARGVSALATILGRRNLDRHVQVAAADDVEPAWDPAFRQTRDFYRGYRSAGVEQPLYDYGSLDGGVGRIWTAQQAFYVAGGMRYARVLPEIYTAGMAREWAELAWIAVRRFHRPLRFAGVTTQGTWRCHCSLPPAEARRLLRRELVARVGWSAARLSGPGTIFLGSYRRLAARG